MAKLANYKTEKRPAKVGERILITNRDENDDRYSNGDIGLVTSLDKVYGIYVDINEYGHVLIFHSEYEVIIENGGGNMNAGIIEKMQAEIAELQAKVTKLEGGKMATMHAGEVVIPAKSAQQQRDEIVAKAKADIDDRFFTDNRGRNQVVDTVYGHSTVEFIINPEKRTVVALLRRAYFCPNEVRAKGIAKCAPNDCFNSHIGKAIALRRALGLEVPAEYLKAPQPTEVQVGDVLKWSHVPYKYEVISTEYKDGNILGYYHNGSRFEANGGNFSKAKIIDDSHY